MAFADRFTPVDDLITSLLPAIQATTDVAVLANYAGFIAVSSVTVYELAIKEIFCDFADKKHKVFGVFVDAHFKKINGRITTQAIKREHLPQFGKKYVDNFKRLMEIAEKRVLVSDGVSIHACYNNLIGGRHDFVHKGIHSLSHQEAINNFRYGKEVISTLSSALRR